MSNSSEPQSIVDRDWDVVVVGGGNAALSAAITARQAGRDVLLIEAAPEKYRGGNSYFAGGGVRFTHEGLADLVGLMPELEPYAATIDVPAYSASQYFDDLGQDTNYLSDPETLDLLISGSRAAVEFLHEQGIRFAWSLGRHAFEVDGRFVFPPGLAVNVGGAGAGLVDGLFAVAARIGVVVSYETRLTEILVDSTGQVTGLRCDIPGSTGRVIGSPRVILACGGFESNPALRAQYLGKNWDLARVRGTRYNLGAGLQAALAIGAEPFGHYSGCHAVQSDANLPWSGDHSVGDLFARHSYPFGVVVNKYGERFFDEGADFQPHTYAKYGREVLEQDDAIAYQLFDAESVAMTRAEYRHRRTTHEQAETVRALADRIDVDPDALERTLVAYNASLVDGISFDPNVLDGKRTAGIAPPKSNWALPISTPPFHAYPVTTGITFTFGGVHVDEQARVLRVGGGAIGGLYAAGELVGGLYFHNYPSGTGLMAGTVFGRLAGAAAAAQ